VLAHAAELSPQGVAERVEGMAPLERLDLIPHAMMLADGGVEPVLYPLDTLPFDGRLGLVRFRHTTPGHRRAQQI
jgi:hypothetical protein